MVPGKDIEDKMRVLEQADELKIDLTDIMTLQHFPRLSSNCITFEGYRSLSLLRPQEFNLKLVPQDGRRNLRCRARAGSLPWKGGTNYVQM